MLEKAALWAERCTRGFAGRAMVFLLVASLALMAWNVDTIEYAFADDMPANEAAAQEASSASQGVDEGGGDARG